MSYTLFIDDERFPVDPTNIVVRSSSEAIQVVTVRGCPAHICFDHDLGGDDTSMRFCRWFADYAIDNKVDLSEFSWSVHSQNPVGAANIESYMTSLMKHVNPDWRCKPRRSRNTTYEICKGYMKATLHLLKPMVKCSKL